MKIMQERLKLLRKEANKTQQDIADYLNFARSSYNGYEKGNSEPSFDTLLKLANLYNVTTDYLLGNMDLKLSPKEIEFVNQIELSNEELMKRYIITIDDNELKPEQIISLIQVARDLKQLSNTLREIQKKD